MDSFLNVRELEWFCIDKYAERHLEQTELVLFHPALFRRAIQRARSNSSVTVGVATVAHPDYVRLLYETECGILGISNDRQSVKKRYQNSESTVSQFDYVVAFSDFVKMSYEERGFPGEKIFVANSDIDHSRFTPAEKKLQDFNVLYVANTSLLKGLHYLLDAWTACKRLDAKLIIVGKIHNVPPELKEKIDGAREDPTIEFLGYQSNISEQYKKASVFVLPSLTEGNPRVVMEAMACGVPVITTENAKSIVDNGKTGYIIPIRDSKAIAEKIEYLYRNPDVGLEVGRAAREAVVNKRYFGDRVYEVCEMILAKEKHL